LQKNGNRGDVVARPPIPNYGWFITEKCETPGFRTVSFLRRENEKERDRKRFEKGGFFVFFYPSFGHTTRGQGTNRFAYGLSELSTFSLGRRKRRDEGLLL
jgi:hypothetical protein